MRSAKRKWVLSLLAVSVVLLLLPDRWTGHLISLIQIVVPLQDAAGTVGDKVAGRSEAPDSPVSAETHEALQRRCRALENGMLALSARTASLEAENRVLTALREGGLVGAGVGPRGRLIPARVVTGDLLPWRSSRSIDAGTLRGVRRGAPVTSRLLEIDRGAEDGVFQGLAILRAETLVGVIHEAGTHTAHVKLLSDIDSQMPVRLGNFVDEAFELHPRQFWLMGRGRGFMEIRDISWSDVQAEVIGVGAVVLSDSRADLLPASLTIGTITAIEHDRANPLLAIATVRAPTDDLFSGGVYVFDPQFDETP